MKQPLLTVVMPAFNGEKYISAAIDSVLNQTFKNFELIIINDGSSDKTNNIVLSFKDERIRFIDLKKNRGIAFCRNLGLQEARGEFLAWTDCDDLNLPTRFEKQLNFLQNNSNFGGCGTWLSRFKGEKTYYINKAYGNPEKIKAALLFKPASIPNPTAMLRLSGIRMYNIKYDENLQIGEDYDFIFRCSQYMKFTNIQENLYMYRDSETSIMKKFDDKDLETYNILKIVYKKVLATLDMEPSEKELRTHYELCSTLIFSEFSEFERCYNWLEKIKRANDLKQAYNVKMFNNILMEQFFFLSKKASGFGFKTLIFFLQKSIKNYWIINPEQYMRLAVRCTLKYKKFEFKLT